MKNKAILKKIGPVSLATVMSLTGIYGYATPLVQVHAAEDAETQLGSIIDVKKVEKNIVEITYQNGYKGRLTFLDNGIFRFNVDPSGKFELYATPNNKEHTGRIQQQPDDSDEYTKPEANITEGDIISISAGNTVIEFNKANTLMTVKRADGSIVLKESEPLQIASGNTKQVLEASDDEYFYGGGTQNGRFSHKGQVIKIENTNNWVDGGVSSPNPFYWSTKGYGVLRNTFKPGAYDFQNSSNGVITTHSEKEFDAYYFVSKAADASQTAEELLQDYYKVTGNAILLPEYGFYLGHLNCYNRDGWDVEKTDATLKNGKAGGHSQWTLEDGNKYWENGLTDGYVLKPDAYPETLNGTIPTELVDNFHVKGSDKDDIYKFSARAVIDGHEAEDMPLGWFLPNDGYGCGYGQNGYEYTGGSMEEKTKAIDANVANLKDFTDYAKTKGVTTGLWTQSRLTPSESNTIEYQKLRDFEKEVKNGGVTTLKTDVAWVGEGYSFGLDGITRAYNTVTETKNRPNIITLDGWAGTQRYGSIWTGDQYGGDWEYIRFHIPTYIGQSLSGNPNIGSDIDGIFGGSTTVSTRDYQWKSFTPQMLDMDGWGALAKKPYYNGDPYTAINRMYLKLKAELMPYTYTLAKQATNGLPMIRAMFLEYPNEGNAFSKRSTEYQYMYGSNFLVAPVYEDVDADENGNDVRNGIYLPDENQIWIDYFTGKQYKGGQTLNNFDAPIWKLPLFVKNGSIVPMYEEHNNPQAITDTNKNGLDKTKRVVEFWPAGSTNFTLYEDDGNYVDNSNKEEVSYGGNVTTKFTSEVDGTTATLKAAKSIGSYNGYDSERNTTFVVNVSKEPTKITAKNGNSELSLKKVNSQEEFDKANGNVYFYNEAPNLNKYSEAGESFNTEITTNPKLYVKFAKTNVNQNDQTLVIEGFENKADFSKEEVNENLSAPVLTQDEEVLTPTSVTLNWNEIDGADTYEIMTDGIINNVGNHTSFLDRNLDYHSSHTYKVRARNAAGYSEWSNELNVTTLEDPWRNVPEQSVIWEHGDDWGALENANDRNFNSMFHSTGDARGQDLIIDMKDAYQLDKFEYYPRGAGQSGDGAVSSRSNGIISQLDVSISMDGKHWTKVHNGADDTWTYNNGESVQSNVKTVDLNGNAARYVKLNVVSSVGGFFATNGIYVHKKDGTNSFAVGSNLNKPTVTEGDYTNMNQYVGVSKNYHPTIFESQIKAHYADINNNDVYDAYDYAFTMFKLDGGTTKTGDVKGNMLFIPSADSVKAGETFTVDVYGDSMENVNGFGALINYDPDMIGDVSATANPYVASLENLTINTPYDDGSGATLNMAFLNKGDKALVSGNHTIATITMKAKQDINLKTKAADSFLHIENGILIGPNFSTVEAKINETPEIPVAPDAKDTIMKESDLNLTLTNEFLPTDDGTNVEKLIHGKEYSGLFNGGTDDNGFEFFWNIEDEYKEECVVLPVTLHAALKEEQTLSKINLFNRNGLGQGAVHKVKYTITYADDSVEEKVIEGKIEEYAYTPLKADVKVKNVDIEVFAAEDATEEQKKLLTLSELQLVHTDKVNVTDVILDENNAKELFVREISPVKATVTTDPDNDANKFYKVESSNPEVANIIVTGEGNNISYLVHTLKAGTTTITITSITDPSKSKSYELTVKEGISTTDLMDAINKGNKYGSTKYTEESFKALQDALNAATELLKNETYTQAQIDSATTAILSAINGLVVKPLDQNLLINTEANKAGVTINSVSSEITAEDGEDGIAANVLDYDEGTYWHTNYMNEDDLKMPQDIVFNLGKSYDLSDVTFLPRQNQGGANGDILKAEIQISKDGETFTSAGVFEFENNGTYLTSRDWQRASFDTMTGQYVKFIVLSAGGNEMNAYASMAEIRFYGNETKEVIVVDKNALQNAINEASLLHEADYTPETWKEFAIALEAAKDIMKSETADQAAVDKAVNDLADKKDKLEKVNADIVSKVLLKAEIATAEQLDKANYTEKTWKVFEAALKEAKRVDADENATVTDVDKALKALRNARLGLEKIADEPIVNPTTGKEALAKLVNDMKAYDQANYTADSWKNFEAALKNAQAVLDNENATAEEIENAQTALKKAMSELKAIEKKPEEPVKPVTPDKDNNQNDNKPSQDNTDNGDVDTADHTNTGLLAGTMLAAGIGAVLLLKKKKEETE